MMTNDKKDELRQKDELKQNIDRVTKGVGAVTTEPRKAVGLVSCWAVLALFWKARHTLLGYALGDPLAPLKDLLTASIIGVSAVAAPSALLWAWGGPLEAGAVQDDMIRAGIVNSIGEPPVLAHVEKAHDLKIYTFQACGIPLKDRMDSADALQTVLNRSIGEIRYGADHQHIQIVTAPPTTILPNHITYHDRLLPCEQTVLLLGRSVLGAVTIDLRTIPYLIIGGSTNSGKTTILKVLLLQCFQHGMAVYVADFKGAVDFGAWWADHCDVTDSLDGLVQTLEKFCAELERRKKLFRTAGCSNIEHYNAQTAQHLRRMVFATDEATFVFDKSGKSKEEKDLIDKIAAKLSIITAQGRAFGLHTFLSTQRPDAQVFPPFVRSNIDTRICGRADTVLSEIILGSTIADELIPKTSQGRFVLNDGCGSNVTVFQSYRLPDLTP